MGHNSAGEAFRVRIEDVCVYDARENFYAGRTLENISGTPSLYLANREQTQFSFALCGNNKDESWIEFDNGKVWGFCNLTKPKNDMLRRFATDYVQNKQTSWARIDDIFSDSMTLSLKSENAFLTDLLVWHYAPKTQPVI